MVAVSADPQAPEPAPLAGRAGDRRAPLVPAHAYFIVSALFHYLGPSFAVLLFARVSVLGVAWLRIASAALILGCWRRPWRLWTGLDRPTHRLLLGWGGTLALMNCCFYEAISRLPLGTVAAIEFAPVVALAALGARSVRNGAALALALGGVALLTRVQLVDRPLGVALALANATLFAIYIVLAHRVARLPSLGGIDGLAAAMFVAAVAVTAIAAPSVVPVFGDGLALLAGVGVGVCSSVIPYLTDQLAMARLPRASYALMTSLLPAIAAIVGLVVLAQVPSVGQALGVLLVITGVAVHRPAAVAAPR